MKIITKIYICDVCGAEKQPDTPTGAPQGWMSLGKDEYHLCGECARKAYLALKDKEAEK